MTNMTTSARSAYAGLLIAALAVPFFSQGLGKGKKVGALPAPTITCAGSTEAGITVTVTAGSEGAAAGFSLQWMTKEDFDLNGGMWYASDDPRLCKSSYSGNAGGAKNPDTNPWSLGAGDSVDVLLGDNFDEIGYSTTCPGDLLCDTTYVIRAFAHATGSFQRSDFTGNLECSTLDCEGCTFTQGYWKTHGPEGCNPAGHANLWPVTELTLGNVPYTDLELCAIFQKPAAGNGMITLAHQLIAAKLNVANGAPLPQAIADAIDEADAMIADLVVPPVGDGFLFPSVTSALVGVLTDYNGGVFHCED